MKEQDIVSTASSDVEEEEEEEEELVTQSSCGLCLREAGGEGRAEILMNNDLED